MKYDSSSLAKLEEQGRKISIAEAKAISRGEPGFERIVSGWYSFQNINSIQRAYNEVLGIDVGKILGRQAKVRDKLLMMYKGLDNLIETRHGIIHHFYLDRDLDREAFLDLLHFVRTALLLVAEGFEQKLGAKLGPG